MSTEFHTATSCPGGRVPQRRATRGRICAHLLTSYQHRCCRAHSLERWVPWGGVARHTVEGGHSRNATPAARACDAWRAQEWQGRRKGALPAACGFTGGSWLPTHDLRCALLPLPCHYRCAVVTTPLPHHCQHVCSQCHAPLPTPDLPGRVIVAKS